MSQKLIAIVPAAGVGARAAQPPAGAECSPVPKQYRPLHGRAMLRWAVEALLADPRIEQVRVAVAPQDAHAVRVLDGLPRTVCRPCGGPTRAATVRAALHDACADPGDWVLVHDAARPGLPADALGRLIDACLQTGTGGILALPVPDTVKRGRAAASPGVDVVVDTISRQDLWLAQTPQMFAAGPLLAALDAAEASGAAVTDEASAAEAAGLGVQLVRGSPRNAKVTWPEDFAMMAAWLGTVEAPQAPDE